MSAFIVNDETISAIVRGFEIYGVEYCAEGYQKPIQILIDRASMRKSIGQHLVNQNYASVNGRYSEDNKPHEFHYVEIPNINAGMIKGCIDCYNYQTCEVDIDGYDYFQSLMYYSLRNLKDKMLEKYIFDEGHEIRWGISQDDIRTC